MESLRYLEEEKDALFYLSEIFGWTYFIAWSVSFYGQVIENYRRKSVSGLNFDFEIYTIFKELTLLQKDRMNNIVFYLTIKITIY